MTDLSSVAEFDDEDIFGDLVPIIERSFQIRFKEDAFRNVETVGDFVDVIQARIDYPHHDSCTGQSVFYKVRNAIAKTQSIDPNSILPETSLEALFPFANRRKQVKAFSLSLGIKPGILSPPEWIKTWNAIGLMLSLISLIFMWPVGLAGIAFFTIGMGIAQRLGKTFMMLTVRELVEKISDEHYMAMRQQEGTVNNAEIWDTVINILSSRIGIDKKYITPESRFSWARKKSLNEI
jgi:hypothetical protein